MLLRSPQQVHRHDRVLADRAALQEQHLVAAGDREQRAQIGFGLGRDGDEFLAAVAHLHHRHAAALPVEHFGGGLAQHGFGEHRGAGAEVEDSHIRIPVRWVGMGTDNCNRPAMDAGSDPLPRPATTPGRPRPRQETACRQPCGRRTLERNRIRNRVRNRHHRCHHPRRHYVRPAPTDARRLPADRRHPHQDRQPVVAGDRHRVCRRDVAGIQPRRVRADAAGDAVRRHGHHGLQQLLRLPRRRRHRRDRRRAMEGAGAARHRSGGGAASWRGRCSASRRWPASPSARGSTGGSCRWVRRRCWSGCSTAAARGRSRACRSARPSPGASSAWC